MGSHPLDQESDEPDRPVKVRAFFGLPLPEVRGGELDRYLSDCAMRATQFRWTRAVNLHLTIRFLGQVDRRVADEVADRLIDSELKAFELELGDVGVFKRGRLARVVW